MSEDASVLLDADEVELELRQFFVVSSREVTLDELADLLRDHRLSGTIRRDERRQGPILYVLLLVQCCDGAPVRWTRRESGGWAFEPVELLAVERLLAAELAATVLSGDRVVGADGTVAPRETVAPLDADDDTFALGVEKLVWMTRSPLDETASVIAGRLGLPCVEAPLHGGSLLVPSGGEERFLEDGLWTSADGVVLWRTRSRRGFSVRRRRRRVDYSWDRVDQRIEPPVSAHASGPASPRDVLDELLEPDLSYREESRLLELDPTRAERLRMLLRRPTSDDTTFREFVDLAGLPSEAAEVVEGRMSADSLPGARLRPPLTNHAALAAATREGWSSASLSRWQDFGDAHPVWFAVISALVVVGALAMAVAEVLAGRGVAALIPLAVFAIWTSSSVRWLRRRPRARRER